MRFQIYILALLVLNSCFNTEQKEINPNNKIITVNILTGSDSTFSNLSYFASDIEYIRLKTPEIFHFNNIFKIISFPDKMYLNVGSDIICFDNTGRFISNCYKPLKEINESFGFIFDFDVSSDEKTVLVLLSDRILSFHNTGTEFLFKRSIILKSPMPSNIEIVPGTTNFLLSIKSFRAKQPSLFLLLSENGDTLFYKTHHFIYGPDNELFRGMIQYKTDNHLCFKEPFNDTVFYVNNSINTFLPRLILDSQGRTYTNFTKHNGIYKNKGLNEFNFIDDIFEASGYIFYEYSYYNLNIIDPNTGKPFRLTRKIIYDIINNKKAEIESGKSIRDDICSGPDIDFFLCSNDKLFTYKYALSLKQYIKSDRFLQPNALNQLKKEELKKLASSLTVEDNPVLVVITLRNKKLNLN